MPYHIFQICEIPFCIEKVCWRALVNSVLLKTIYLQRLNSLLKAMYTTLEAAAAKAGFHWLTSSPPKGLRKTALAKLLTPCQASRSQSLTVSEDSFSIEYKKAEIFSGTYFLHFHFCATLT